MCRLIATNPTVNVDRIAATTSYTIGTAVFPTIA